MHKDKYIFDEIALEKQCYHLATLFLASNSIRELSRRHPGAQFDIFSIYEPQEIKLLLISIAIQLRMIDDLMKNYGRSNYIPTKVTGTIQFTKEPEALEMSLRDACNRVIHAKSLSIVTETTAEVSLAGRDGKRGDWSAVLGVMPFLESALDLIKAYDEDWDVSAQKHAG